MTRPTLRAEFVDAAGRRAFALLRTPPAEAGSCVLVAPAFAEEMNKSRRMITEFAHAANARGLGVLVVDVHGTGDAAGDFADARWNHWLDDLTAAAEWAQRCGWTVDSLLGIRLGCALGAEWAAARAHTLRATAFWQPVTSGARYLEQFLRLRLAAGIGASGARETTAGLRARLDGGETLEIAGYALAPELAAAVARADLANALHPRLGRVLWIDVPASVDVPRSPADRRTIDAALARGCVVEEQRIVGEPFWSSVEIVSVPAVSLATAAALATPAALAA